MSISEYKALTEKKNKFRNEPVVIDGHKFPSKREGGRYLELKQYQKIGIIKDLQLQVPFELYPTHKSGGVTIRGKKYIADFVYVITNNGQKVVEDAKGYATPEYLRKRKMFKERYGFEIQEV